MTTNTQPFEFDWVEEFDTVFNAEVMERELESSIPVSEWTTAGKPTKDRPNGEGYDWWLENGPKFAKAWADWRTSHEDEYELWYDPEGRPGIELPMRVKFGRETVKAFPDRVYRRIRDGRLIVVDLKSGSRSPEDALQINIYRACLELQYPGVKTAMGYFFHARKGEMIPAHGPSKYNLDVIVNLIESFGRALRGGELLPNPGWHCGKCSVKEFCALTGGARAHEFDPLHPAYVEAA